MLNSAGEAQGGQRHYRYFVPASPAVMVTAVMSVAKSHYRQTARVAVGLPGRRWSKINPKHNLVTSSDGSQMVTGTNKVAHKLTNLSRTGLFDVSYIARKRRLGLFGHVARLRSDVPANQVLRICTKTRGGDRPSQEWRHASGRPPTTWIHQICHDTGVTATEALQLAEDRPFWQTIATAGGFG